MQYGSNTRLEIALNPRFLRTDSTYGLFLLDPIKNSSCSKVYPISEISGYMRADLDKLENRTQIGIRKVALCRYSSIDAHNAKINLKSWFPVQKAKKLLSVRSAVRKRPLACSPPLLSAVRKKVAESRRRVALVRQQAAPDQEDSRELLDLSQRSLLR
jgi:hypothetical protein